jgi:hypothetical protein
MLNYPYYNPGNLKVSFDSRGCPDIMLGQIQPDKGDIFCKYESVIYGYRALARQLQIFFEKNIDTLNLIIAKFAPPSDNNNTSVYIANISKWTGIDPKATVLYDPHTAIILCRAISMQENGEDAVLADVVAGVRLLFPYQPQII